MQNIKIINYLKKISLIILIYGIVIRVYQFLNNRPLWSDEMALLSAIIEKKYTDFFLPLGNDQIAPIAFVYLTKVLLSINNFFNFFDVSFIVRFLPLISSIGSLILFYEICKNFYFTRVILIFIFSTSPQIIYYSSEFKQYSLDVFFVLLLFFTYDRMLNFKNFLFFFITGCLAIYFSHTSIIILASILIHWLWSCFKLKKIYDFFLAINYSFFFFLLFVINYYFFLSIYSENINILNFWADKFFKLPITLIDIYQNLKIFFTFYIFSGFLITIFPIIFILCLIASKEIFKNKANFLQLSFVIFILSYFLSLFKIYPFYLRLSLFYMPLFYIIIGYGLEKICNRRSIFSFTIISIILIANFFLHLIDNFKTIDHPRHTNETNVIHKLEKNFFYKFIN